MVCGVYCVVCGVWCVVCCVLYAVCCMWCLVCCVLCVVRCGLYLVCSCVLCGSPEIATRELMRSFLGANMEFGEAQQISPQAPESLENDLKIRSLDFQESL